MLVKKGYESLIVWQKAMELVTEIYLLTEKFPKTELYGLVSQMRRAAVSIPSNIAEGSRRKGKKETQQFFLVAFGSGAELETQLKIARNLQFVSEEECSKTDALLEEVMKILNKIGYQ